MIMHRVAALALMGALVLASTHSWADQSLEDGIEALSGDVLLPSSQLGNVIVKTCVSCPPRSYQLGANTHFVARNKQISFEELKKYFGTASRFPVLIACGVNTQTITRIVVTGDELPR